jgi:sec-independent protein translocase protein TatB
MFPDLSWSHMLLVLVVALVVVGPKDLPKLMRKMGQWTAKARNMADQFRRSFDEMARQSELDELRKEIEELRNARPFAETQAQVEEAMKLPEVSLEPKSRDATGTPAEPDAAASVEPVVPVEPLPEVLEPQTPIEEGAPPLPPKEPS